MTELPVDELLAVELGDRQKERQRHLEFNHLLSNGREWFRAEESLMIHAQKLRLAESKLRIDIQRAAAKVRGEYEWNWDDALASS